MNSPKNDQEVVVAKSLTNAKRTVRISLSVAIACVSLAVSLVALILSVIIWKAEEAVAMPRLDSRMAGFYHITFDFLKAEGINQEAESGKGITVAASVLSNSGRAPLTVGGAQMVLHDEVVPIDAVLVSDGLGDFYHGVPLMLDPGETVIAIWFLMGEQKFGIDLERIELFDITTSNKLAVWDVVNDDCSDWSQSLCDRAVVQAGKILKSGAANKYLWCVPKVRFWDTLSMPEQKYCQPWLAENGWSAIEERIKNAG